MEELKKQLREREESLQALQKQHGCLKNASMDTIQGLQQILQSLERSCADLQASHCHGAREMTISHESVGGPWNGL